ncbi:MAG: carbohydrate kinase family protein [Chloroflexota bacterium]
MRTDRRNSGTVVVIGAAAMDTKGYATEPLQSGTSIAGHVRVSVGGVGRNIAENLARLGLKTMLLSAVGEDEAGRHLLDQAQHSGVNVDQVLISPDHPTGAYLAILDRENNLAVSLADMSIMRAVTPRYLYSQRRWLRQASMVTIDANLSPKTLDSLFRQTRQYGLRVCADPTSTSLASRLCPHLAELYMITPNALEAEALCGLPAGHRDEAVVAAKKLVSLGVEIAIITLADQGLVYATPHASGHIPAMECEIVDLTGAGDALTAAVLFGLLNHFPVDEAVRLGVSAAALTLQCRDTVCSDLSLENLYNRLVI